MNKYPKEYKEYSKVIDKKKILTLPFSNLGQGSIPARNWVWEDSIKRGFERHWIIDDNIRGFYRLNRNKRVYFRNRVFFKIIEDFIDRYENIALAGPHYNFFAEEREKHPPFILNTRIYSCILIKNDLNLRWRGKYNEDTDLSIRCLKQGYCTVLFYAFLCQKMKTMTCKGGNTTELYKQSEKFDGRLEMAKSLQRQHPDITQIKRRWGRWQHVVDYRGFKNNKLILKKNIHISKGINEYGLKYHEK